MNKKSNFSNNDKNAVNIPALTKEERERIFMKSKEKLNRMLEEQENLPVITSENTESKADNEQFEENSDREIKVSRLKPIMSAVACLVLVAGLSGVMFSVYNKNKNVDIKDSSVVQSDTEKQVVAATTTKTTKASVTTASKKAETSEPAEETTVVTTNDTQNYETQNTTENSVQEYPQQTSAAVTTEKPKTDYIQTQKPVTTTITEDDSAKEKDSAKKSEYKKIAENLKESYNTIYYMSMGGGVQYDATKEAYYYQCANNIFSDEYPDGKVPYNYVSDSRFSSTSDIKNFINNVMTANFKANSALSNALFENGMPKFVDYNGQLYGLKILASRSGGGGYAGQIIDIEDLTENSFTAYMDKGSYNVAFKIVKENGVWKIDNVIENG